MKRLFSMFMVAVILVSSLAVTSVSALEVGSFDVVVYSGEDKAVVYWDEVSGADIYKVYITSPVEYNCLSVATTVNSFDWEPFDATLDEIFDVKIEAYDSSGVLIAESIDLQVVVNVANYDYWGIYGDCDFDTHITVIDATNILRFEAQLTEFSNASIKASDVDNNGEVTVLDATIIQRFCAGLSSNEDSLVYQPFWYGGMYFDVLNMSPEKL